jgi:hypothetical protein
MTDRARLLRGPGELRDVAFDASLVTGEFQKKFPIAVGRPDDDLVQFRLGKILMARIAFQDARMVRSGNIDGSEMRVMRETFVVYRLFSRLGIRLLLALHRKSAKQKSRRDQTTEHKGDLDSIDQLHFDPKIIFGGIF